jgi:hypothetical protein
VQLRSDVAENGIVITGELRSSDFEILVPGL